MAARIRYFRASLALDQGELVAAHQDLAQALDDLAGQMRANEYTWWLVERAATLARFCGAPAQAALLYVAGTTHRDAIGALVEPAEREMRARDCAWLQGVLGEAALASALAEGRSLSLDDATANLTQMLHQGRRANDPIS